MPSHKCITCDKSTPDDELIEKHDVYFCSPACLEQYEAKLKELEKITDWDNCC